MWGHHPLSSNKRGYVISRQIKFRGRAIVNDKHNGIKAGDFVFGCFIHSGVDAPCIIFGDGDQIEIDIETLGQYTGLKDCIGGVIYEGDIVSLPIDGEFHNTEISFTVDRDFNGWEITPQHIEDGARIIGTIHQNPELLEQRK